MVQLLLVRRKGIETYLIYLFMLLCHNLGVSISCQVLALTEIWSAVDGFESEPRPTSATTDGVSFMPGIQFLTYIPYEKTPFSGFGVS